MGKTVRKYIDYINMYEQKYTKKPDKIKVSWRERYRIMIELSRMTFYTDTPWRKVPQPDTYWAKCKYEAKKMASVSIHGVPIVS